MDKNSKVIIMFGLLYVISIALGKITKIIFSEQDRQESKLLISIKFFIEVFIILTTLLYIAYLLDQSIYTNIKSTNPKILYFMALLLTTFIITTTHMKNKLKYVFRNNVEHFSDSNNSYYKFNPYKQFNKPFNTTWRGIDNKEYIFNTNTKDYWNNIKKNDIEPEIPKALGNDYQASFSKYTPKFAKINNITEHDKYKFSSLYPGKENSKFTTINYVLQIIPKDIDGAEFQVALNSNTSYQNNDTEITIEDINVGDKLRIYIDEDTPSEFVTVVRIFGDNNIEYLPDYVDYNVAPLNDNTNVVKDINNNNNNNHHHNHNELENLN